MSPPDLPKIMKAVIVNTETETPELTSEQPVPTPAKGEHLIKVGAAGITNGEATWKRYGLPWSKYQVATYDVAGTVVTPVPDSPFKVGDEVYGRINAVRQGGAGEYTILLPAETSKVPKNISPEQAASVPTSAETAWQALFTQAKLKEPSEGEKPEAGKRVLVTAASGGCGIFGVQFAKLIGATVVATCGTKNVDFIRELGADEVVDYRTQSIREHVGTDESKKLDVVLEFAGGRSLQDTWHVVKKGGVLVNITPATFKEPEDGVPEGVKGFWFIMESVGEQLRKISQLIESGRVRTEYDSVHPFEEYQKAFKQADSGHARGKVILTP